LRLLRPPDIVEVLLYIEEEVTGVYDKEVVPPLLFLRLPPFVTPDTALVKADKSNLGGAVGAGATGLLAGAGNFAVAGGALTDIIYIYIYDISFLINLIIFINFLLNIYVMYF